MNGGKGANVYACVTDVQYVHGVTDTMIRFASSKSYNEDAKGNGNGRSFYLELEYRYDPVWSYDNSSIGFENRTAIACDTQDLDSITDANRYYANIRPAKKDKHVYHLVTWYTTVDGQSSGDVLNYLNDQNERVTASYTEEVDCDHLRISYAAPQEWCYAWPRSTTGWGFFKMETWYQYTPHSESATDVPIV